MLKELKFVSGAVAKKDLLPAMTHFCIEGGHVRSYNGTLALSSPIAFNLDCKPKATDLVKAINNCNETITLSMTDTGRLRIQSGSFKAFIECVQGDTPHVMPEGEEIHFDGEQLLKAVTTLERFVGSDASRPWSNGILLRGQSAFATNNVCLVEYWTGFQFPLVVNIPLLAVREMLRINEAPTHGQVTENSITFHYEDGRWIRTQLYNTEWPDLAKVLDAPCKAEPLSDIIFEGAESLKPFADKMGRVYLEGETMRTHLDPNEGASFSLEGHVPYDLEGIYQIEMLKLLKGVATSIDFSLFPSPAIFYGDRLRGAIVGMKL